MTKQIEGVDRNSYAGQAIVACQAKARGILGDENEAFRLLDFVNLMLLNNRFADKGIFITDTNKEECYIKIIELGEESLINDLEKFINLKDEIKVIEKKREEYLSIVEQLRSLPNANDVDAVNGIVESYLRR